MMLGNFGKYFITFYVQLEVLENNLQYRTVEPLLSISEEIMLNHEHCKIKEMQIN
jgi:hypothetical protein